MTPSQVQAPVFSHGSGLDQTSTTPFPLRLRPDHSTDWTVPPQHLSNLLEQKSSQLQMLGTIGQEILKQQQELEERIKGFEDDDTEEVGEGTKEKLRELDEAMRAWESQNEGMMRELGGKVGPRHLSGLSLSSGRCQTAWTNPQKQSLQRHQLRHSVP